MAVKKIIVLCLTGLVALTVGGAAVFASISHYVSGTGGGMHNMTSHNSFNPTHSWVAIGADHSQYISSGGMYHDYSSTLGWHAPFNGDYALDIDGGTGSPYNVYMYLTYAGYATGSTVTTNNNYPISIEAVAGYVKNLYPSSPDAACWYQSFEFHVDYFDSGGTHHEDNIGTVYYLHLAQASFGIAPLTHIAPNVSRPNPYGSGYIYDISGLFVGTDYAGTGVCSSGKHTHIESVSNHDWGAPYEWHGLGPDYFNPSHIHYIGNYFPPYTYTRDYVNQGQTLGFMGGNTTMQAMWDNPNSTTH